MILFVILDFNKQDFLKKYLNLNGNLNQEIIFKTCTFFLSFLSLQALDLIAVNEKSFYIVLSYSLRFEISVHMMYFRSTKIERSIKY